MINDHTNRGSKLKIDRGLFGSISFCLYLAGLIAPATGLFLFVINAIWHGPTPINFVANLLIIISIPLLLASSHFLDLNDKDRP